MANYTCPSSITCGSYQMKTYRSLTHLIHNNKTSTSTKYWQLSKSWILCQRLQMTIEKCKTIYMVHILIFDRGDRSPICFNRATQNYGLWQKNMMKKYFLSVKKHKIFLLVELNRLWKIWSDYCMYSTISWSPYKSEAFPAYNLEDLE